MSQHPEGKSKKSGGKSESGKASNVKSGHGNAREKSPKKQSVILDCNIAVAVLVKFSGRYAFDNIKSRL